LQSNLFGLQTLRGCAVVRLNCAHGTNRLTGALVRALTSAVRDLAANERPLPLILAGNEQFFSAGADLREIRALAPGDALEFSRGGQELMLAIERFPAPTWAAISGYCMGGGLDLALACGGRIASPGARFGHRGAAFGLITGWGGTQRLPRLVGKARALQMLVAAEELSAAQALRAGLVDALAADPVQFIANRIAGPERRDSQS
jgi:enoyl-CoA hydratase/carnithine racemase